MPVNAGSGWTTAANAVESPRPPLAHAAGSPPPPLPHADRRPRHRPGVLAAIAAGGALGGMARYGLGLALPAPPTGFPSATWSVNVSGCFLLALVTVLSLDLWPPTRYLRPFAAIGLLGAYTTFSTYLVESVQLLRHGVPTVAVGYLAGSLAAGLLAAVAGFAVARRVVARGTVRRR